ncbi:MAG: outer membrane beta-barrel protein [Rhodothermales bacterium]|nr:outer membrane beta-barrel protein [Rhodothermales bacterium]
MRTLVLCALIASTVCFVPSVSAQVGVAAGLNFENLGDIQATSRRATFDNSTGYHIGIYFDLGGGKVSLRPGLFYRDAGDVVLSEGLQESVFDLSTIEVPLDVRVKLVPSSVVSPYVLGGPVVAFASSSDDGFNDAVRNLLLSANAGIGIDLAMGSIVLSPELRFAFSVNRWLEENRTIRVGGATISSDEVSRQSAVMLRLGLSF